MMLLWLGLGFCLGILVASMRAADIEAQNRELRSAIARVRSALLLGNLRWAKSECERALEDEVAA